MKKQTGIWIDTKKAMIVFLEGDGHKLSYVFSFIEGRGRIPGETRWFTRLGKQFLDFEKRKENRKNNAVRNYLVKVIDEVRDTDELVIFGPAEMKKELEKLIRQDKIFLTRLKAVEPADSITENQVVAMVKHFYQNKSIQ
jgi:hypothetical protein